MPITLQSSTGGFSPEFLRKLPQLEAAMRACGLEPDAFIISKDRSASVAYPLGPFFFDYTVYIDGEHFTVTEPNDSRFLDYFIRRCVEAAGEEPSAHHKADGLLQRFIHWMAQPI